MRELSAIRLCSRRAAALKLSDNDLHEVWIASRYRQSFAQAISDTIQTLGSTGVVCKELLDLVHPVLWASPPNAIFQKLVSPASISVVCTTGTRWALAVRLFFAALLGPDFGADFL